MDKRTKISVIVPVYKAEKFLHSCIDSILAQTYTNYDVVLVDDGSPDQSGEICDEYAKNNERIRVIHQENAGPAKARAVGVEVSVDCDFIAFVDSDDTLSPTALHELSEHATDEFDIIVADYDRNDKQYINQEIEVPEFVNRMYLYEITPSPCARLFRRSLFNSGTFEFPQGFIMGEDFVMNLRLAFASQKRIKIIPSIVYYYNNNMDSTMNTFEYTLDYLALSYQLKLQSIPEFYRKECMPYCIANVLKSNHLIVRHYCDTGKHKPTPLHQQVLNDIRTYGCKGMWWERFSLHFSNPLYSHFYLGMRKLVIILKKIKRRLN